MSSIDVVSMPSGQDDQMVVWFLPADELLPAVAIFLIGVGINQKLIALVLAVYAVKRYRKMKEGNQDGLLLHLLYWIGVLGVGKGKSFPNPFIREFVR